MHAWRFDCADKKLGLQKSDGRQSPKKLALAQIEAVVEVLKILKYGVIGWLVLSILTLPLYWPYARMFWVFIPIIPEARFEAPANAAEARLQDIDYLSTLPNYDRSFNEVEKLSFAEKLEQMRRSADGMSGAEFYLAIAEAVALADNGHTNVSHHPQYATFNTIGVRLYGFEDGVYILNAAQEKQHLLGRRVVTVEGVPVDTVKTVLAKYRGGAKTSRKLYSTFLIESPNLLNASGLAASTDVIEMELETPNGELELTRFEAIPIDNPEALAWRSPWRTMAAGENAPAFENWKHILDTENAITPLYLTNLDAPLAFNLEGNGFYIRALAGFSADGQSIKNAYDSILSEHPRGSLDYLVVDFRLHDGGDYTKSIAFAKTAPKIVKENGDIYIVTGPNTFSAAIVTAAMLKHYAGERALIIGEQMGDHEQFWAERGTSFRLPNSGYDINYATGYHDWEQGCKGVKYCYTMNEIHEVPAGSLAPEIILPQTFEGYQRGEDVVLNWVAQRHE